MPRRSLVLLLLLASPAFAQQPPADPSKLTLDRIFASDEFRGERVPPIKWTGKDGAYTTLTPSKTHKGASDIERVELKGNREVLVPAEKLIPPSAKEPLAIHGYEFSKDFDVVLIYTNSQKVWRANTRGDYWTFSRSTGKFAKLGGDAKPATLMFAKLSPKGDRVGYVRENNLYVEPIDGGPPTRLTADGTPEIINGTFDWVYEEEFFCRDGWRWSPDGTRIAYWQLDTRGVKTFTLIDNTSGTYPTLKTFAYPKTGERNSACRIGVVDAKGGETKWMEITGDTKNDYYIPRMEWEPNGKFLSVRRINRLQNAVDVMRVSPDTGEASIVLTDRDGAWVDIHDDAMMWLDRGKFFTWISERDGWRHLYVVSRDGKDMRRVTSGDYDVIRVVHIDEAAGIAYFVASPNLATGHHLYRISLKGNGEPEAISPCSFTGWQDYDISPDGKAALEARSAFGIPPWVEMITLPDGGWVNNRPLVSNQKLLENLDKLAGTGHEFFRLDIGDGVKLDGWFMYPINFDPKKKYPLLFHVYGEPAGQSVTDRWGGNQYLWHLMLTQQGYAVACIDNRGTPCPRGRDFRKAAYRRVGTLASEDQASACRALLKERPYLDPSRVGVWGWSGGGSMTLNLLFRYPDLYRTGMAVAPVPDMRLYDTIYQERYMGLPQVNAEDYKNGSPITHAAGLKGNLLIIHGTGDDNVHYQGTELLANRLIELNKPFTLMAYPNRSHSINEGKNTTRHLYGLMTRYLNDNLPSGPKP